MIHTVKGFSVVNEEKKFFVFFFVCLFFLNGIYLALFTFQLNDGSLISDSSAFSKSSLYISKLSVHILLKPSLKDFEHNFISM